jgi:hypothetical protein
MSALALKPRRPLTTLYSKNQSSVVSALTSFSASVAVHSVAERHLAG